MITHIAEVAELSITYLQKTINQDRFKPKIANYSIIPFLI